MHNGPRPEKDEGRKLLVVPPSFTTARCGLRGYVPLATVTHQRDNGRTRSGLLREPLLTVRAITQEWTHLRGTTASQQPAAL